MPADYNTFTVTTGASNVPVQLINGMAARRTLVITGGGSGATFVGTSGGDFQNKIFARVDVNTTLILKVSELGPLITGEIWVASPVINQTINGAQVYDVPTARK